MAVVGGSMLEGVSLDLKNENKTFLSDVSDKLFSQFHALSTLNEVDYSWVGLSLYRNFSVEHFLPDEAKKKKLVALRYVKRRLGVL